MPSATMRLEGPMYYKALDDDREALLVSELDDADFAVYTASAVHPVDGHEFGLAVTHTPPDAAFTDFHKCELQKALDRYLADNPDGERDA